jgi:chemotaxis protein methyltransferase CheR
MLSREQFERVRRLALELAGIELVERHWDLIARRAPRLDISDSAAFEMMLREVEAGNLAAARRFVQVVTTKFTAFFRHPEQFRLAAAHCVQAARERGHARLWCAGTATGEEAYSLAISLTDAFSDKNPPVTILATDLDAEALAIAQRGEYSAAALDPVAPEIRERYFVAGQPGRVTVERRAAQLINFRVLNLASADWSVDGSFDVVFCRNVLMYMAGDWRQRIVERIRELLAPEGLLIIDPVESLGESRTTLLQAIAPGVYADRNTNAPRMAPTARGSR